MAMGKSAFFKTLMGVCLCWVALASAGAREISEKSLRHHISVLASDEMKGRQAGGETERQVIQYIASQFFDYGLVSGTNNPVNPWFAPVELIERITRAETIEFRRRGRIIRINHDDIHLRGTIDDKSTGALPIMYVGRWGACSFADQDARVGSSSLVPPKGKLQERIALMLWNAGECPEGQEALSVADRKSVV